MMGGKASICIGLNLPDQLDNLTKRLGQLPRSRCAARIGPISWNIPRYTYRSLGAARRLRGCAAIPTLSRRRLTRSSGGLRRSDRTRLRGNAFVGYARSIPPLALWRPAARSLRFTRFWSCRRLISCRSSRSGRRRRAGKRGHLGGCRVPSLARRHWTFLPC
jgi:hypothetical protein